MKKKNIVFITGTRADYGKLKSLMREIQKCNQFELHIFVTGMHMLSKYGSTYSELEKDGFKNIHKFVNTRINESMDITLSNTIVGFSNYVAEFKPDLIVVHGDRVEALAGAIVGALNNIKVAHIEGGEISGTIDESIRHAITKFSHFHLVANEEAKNCVIQLGEKESSIFVIGSPDMDIMFSKQLPDLQFVKQHYDIEFEEYGIFMYHPVTTEIHHLKRNIMEVVNSLIDSGKNYIVVYPNNDPGSDIIFDALKILEGNNRFRCFPSIRFEAFLVLLQNATFMIGNSSAGVRETCVYGVPTIDIGTRQKGRYDKLKVSNVQHVNESKAEILKAIDQVDHFRCSGLSLYGNGNSSKEFINFLHNDSIWDMDIQKKFIPFNSQF
ncbi:UDP-N-acetylglucosamine 2-epimerase (hydrolyzing) [Bacillus thermophilus]|uniref:UDP-N-acetylglucosamine 2-epimerase (Hydrolyzing) n=1 Tax=Siminovitchia thermophila TaxID=1245522 RepID=A0ABS2R3I4_9BACI|nr:UDP-N-acetylglucosamine 2-epimerase [Siminovitchia thermophila]MBM7714198.1 UDP-N-acetylglucosamine 2-epimerase (hydrolyzing) [Siminovitchia thermophila]ONK23385.1 UDP-N-acetylglucosamine 2-epimerase (hydrolyzing) [Bacillus sp. VT-16-64]